MPQIYPMVEFKNDTKIDIIEGVTTVWGELDMDKLPNAYITYQKPTEGNQVWQAEMITAQQLKQKFQNKIISKVFTYGRRSEQQLTQAYTDIPWKKGNAKFSTHSVYPNYVLSTMMMIDGDYKGAVTQKEASPYILGGPFVPYRSLPYYILKRNGEQHSFKYIYGVKPDIQLEKVTLPPDWSK